MVSRFFKSMFGDFSKEELKKFLLLALIFGLTIGAYWLLRPLKDSVFATIIGMKENQPLAKILSLFVVFPLVIVYGKLVDKFPRHKLFYILAIIYGLLAIGFGFGLMHSDWGLPNTDASPWRLIGWAFYIYVESFGSLMVALFWAFAADTTTPESAKRGYPILAAGAQMGGILGPLAVWSLAKTVGTSNLVFVGAGLIFSIIPLIAYLMKVVPKEQFQGYEVEEEKVDKPKKPKVGFAEGLKLMLSQPYLLGIFGVVSLFEIIATIFDYRFKSFASAVMHGDELTKFFGLFGIITNCMALACILLGVNNIGRKLGLTVSLLTLPLVVGVLSVLNIVPNLWVAMGVVALAKALNYALNQPSKEQLYIPTSKNAKYKAKAWVEMFGSRGSKAAGSLVNITAPFLGNAFVPFATAFSLVMVGIWAFIARYLGRTHKKAIEEGKNVC